jgi:hypothetical protein
MVLNTYRREKAIHLCWIAEDVNLEDKIVRLIEWSDQTVPVEPRRAGNVSDDSLSRRLRFRLVGFCECIEQPLPQPGSGLHID